MLAKIAQTVILGIFLAIPMFLLILALGLLFALFTMWMWNFVVPYLFATGVRGEIDFLHAWALNVLCGMLFKGTSSSSSS